MDGASWDLKHWRAVLLFPSRTSHTPGTALNVPSDTHNCKDILEYISNLCTKVTRFTSVTSTLNPITAAVMAGRRF